MTDESLDRIALFSEQENLKLTIKRLTADIAAHRRAGASRYKPADVRCSHVNRARELASEKRQAENRLVEVRVALARVRASGTSRTDAAAAIARLTRELDDARAIVTAAREYVEAVERAAADDDIDYEPDDCSPEWRSLVAAVRGTP